MSHLCVSASDVVMWAVFSCKRFPMPLARYRGLSHSRWMALPIIESSLSVGFKSHFPRIPEFLVSIG